MTGESGGSAGTGGAHPPLRAGVLVGDVVPPRGWGARLSLLPLLSDEETKSNEEGVGTQAMR